MIAPRKIPQPYLQWNADWSAPHGREAGWAESLPNRMMLKRRGPFAWQPNNTTRQFEFPWAHDMVNSHGAKLDVLEIGGGVSGLQFVLAQEGHRVTNVDPGQPELGWGMKKELHNHLCATFNAPVTLLETTIDRANVPSGSMDVVMCVSALEHFPDDALQEFYTHAARVLKPTGVAVLTVDLFLDLQPFCSQGQNEFGRNVDVSTLLDRSGLSLVKGDRSELKGFAEFDADRIQCNLSKYLVGAYPAMAQCVVAKPAR